MKHDRSLCLVIEKVGNRGKFFSKPTDPGTRNVEDLFFERKNEMDSGYNFYSKF